MDMILHNAQLSEINVLALLYNLYRLHCAFLRMEIISTVAVPSIMLSVSTSGTPQVHLTVCNNELWNSERFLHDAILFSIRPSLPWSSNWQTQQILRYNHLLWSYLCSCFLSPGLIAFSRNSSPFHPALSYANTTKSHYISYGIHRKQKEKTLLCFESMIIATGNNQTIQELQLIFPKEGHVKDDSTNKTGFFSLCSLY